MPMAQFPAYRDYRRARVSANDAMMALLAGAQLAINTLRLTEGSSLRLSEVFPRVQHIGRFDQPVAKASAELRLAEPHLTAIAIPYALSLHESFVLACIDLLRLHGHPVSGAVNAKSMHGTVFAAMGAPVPGRSLELFQMLRVMRNSHIHQGGRPSTEFPAVLAAMSTGARQKFLDVTGRVPERIIQEGLVAYVLGDVFLAFATTNALGQDLNRAMQGALAVSEWAEIIAADFWSTTGRTGGGVVEWNALKRYASTYYSMVLRDADLWEGSQRASPGRLESLGAIQAQQRNSNASRSRPRTARQ